jgi:O-antigen/teichoic acid export membrane protein
MYGVIVWPILSLIFPIVTELITKAHHEKFATFQNILYKYFSVFALSIGGLFFAFGPEIASVLFGTKFMYSGQLLMYIGPFLIFNVLTSINYGILAGFGKVKQRVIVI